MEEMLGKLNKLKDAIADSERTIATLQGRKEETMNRLKEEGFDSIEAAKKFLMKSEKELNTLESTIKEKFDQLKECYEW